MGKKVPGNSAKELAALKYCLPKEARTVLKNSITWANDEDQNDPALNLRKLGLYYTGTKNIIHERVEFNRMFRLESEPINHWETRCREQAVKCEYCKTCTPQLIRDRFIVGINDDNLLSKLVNSAVKDATIELETVVLHARQYEATKNKIKSMATTSVEEQVNFTRSTPRQKPKPSTPKSISTVCAWCAEPQHINGKNDCPAQGKQCYSCGKMNHLSKACLHPDPRWRQKRNEVTVREQSATVSKQKGNHQVHQLESDESPDKQQYAEFPYSSFSIDLEDIVYGVETNYPQTRKGKKYFVDLNVAGLNSDHFTKVQFQIDSAATCNTLPLPTLRQITDPDHPDCGIRPSKSNIKMYNNASTHPVGIIDLTCERNGKQNQLQFQIVDGPEFNNKPPLLSGSDCELLNVLKVYPDEIHSLSTASSCTELTTPLNEQTVTQVYKDVFEGLGCIGDPVHIRLNPDITPVQAGVRRYPIHKTEKIADRIREMISQGYLAPVTEPTPWCSPMTAVERPDKPNHPIRICMDPVRTLNLAIQRPVYPMPTLEENLHKLVNAKCFTMVDALVGFSQVPLDKESSLLTTMHTPIGRVKWLRLPFGISSAPEEFQRRQHEVIEGLAGVINVADDILIFGKGNTYEEASEDHDKNLIALLDRCRERNLKLNPRKLKFKLTSVSFMGHTVTDQGLVPDNSKIEAITRMPVPQDKKATQRFIGMCNFLSQYLPKLSEICAPLREVSTPQAEFCWSSTQQDAFSKVKELISSAPVLQFYDSKLPVTLQVDASEKGLGGALLQNGKPVAYTSSTLTQAERDNYAQIEKECLAIVNAMSRWDQWLFGHQSILVETDHKPLETIFKRPISDAPMRLQKMMLKLRRYTFTVHYRKGSTMWLADTLSRAPLSRTHQTDRDFEIFALDTINTEHRPGRILDHTYEEIKTATAEDPLLSHLIPYITHGWPEEKHQLPPELTPFWNYRSELIVAENVIYKGTKIIIPQSMRARMLEKIHSPHQGIEKSIMNASDTLFWPSMRSDIKTACENCSICAEYATQHQKEPMLSYPIPSLPWQFVSQDILKYDGNYYLVTVDHYSDFFELDKLQDTLASTVVSVTKTIFARHGSPMKCLTDNGPQFASSEYSNFARSWNFNHISSSPYYSQSNGRAEAAVKAAKSLLKKCKDPLLGLLHLRNTPTKGHQSTPTQRLMSRRTRTTLPVAAQLLEPSVVPSDSVTTEKEHLRTSSKRYYDQTAGAELPKLEVGDHVYIKPRPSEHNKAWNYGIISNIPAPRSYTIKTPSGTARRNSRQIRVAAPPSSNINMPNYVDNWNTTPYLPTQEDSPPVRYDHSVVNSNSLHNPRPCQDEKSTQLRSLESTDTQRKIVTPLSKPIPVLPETNTGIGDDKENVTGGYRTRSGRLSKPPAVMDV